MANKSPLTTSKFTDWLIGIFFELPWIEVWKLLRQLWRGLADEGMYEVLEYESVLELREHKGGKRASFQKKREGTLSAE